MARPLALGFGIRGLSHLRYSIDAKKLTPHTTTPTTPITPYKMSDMLPVAGAPAGVARAAGGAAKFMMTDTTAMPALMIVVTRTTLLAVEPSKRPVKAGSGELNSHQPYAMPKDATVETTCIAISAPRPVPTPPTAIAMPTPTPPKTASTCAMIPASIRNTPV